VIPRAHQNCTWYFKVSFRLTVLA